MSENYFTLRFFSLQYIDFFLSFLSVALPLSNADLLLPKATKSNRKRRREDKNENDPNGVSSKKKLKCSINWQHILFQLQHLSDYLSETNSQYYQVFTRLFQWFIN
jgi:hypothetical protein